MSLVLLFKFMDNNIRTLPRVGGPIGLLPVQRQRDGVGDDDRERGLESMLEAVGHHHSSRVALASAGLGG